MVLQWTVEEMADTEEADTEEVDTEVADMDIHHRKHFSETKKKSRELRHTNFDLIFNC